MGRSKRLAWALLGFVRETFQFALFLTNPDKVCSQTFGVLREAPIDAMKPGHLF